MKYLMLLIFLFALLAFASTETDNLIRVTTYGKIRGELVSSAADPTVEFYSFRGVPYARPPIGKFRFRAPVSPKSWSGIRNTTESSEKCVQIADNFNGKGVIGSEDCLYLEIFEPKTARERNNQYGPLPVMVWIHGGTFIFGTASTTGSDYVMEKPVVVVTVQYRVNVFGFLSTEDSYARGNHGLKDQLQALKWVRKNIKYFGGDPNKVTIFGESAGGASVLYHIISRKSRGYFHRAISQSGSALNRWAFQTNPREMAFKLGKHFGIETTSSQQLVASLRKIDYKKLEKAAFDKSVVGFYTPYYAQPFAPSLEKKSDAAFLHKSMFESLEKGEHTKVPYMSGYNTEEGSFAYDYIENGRANINLYELHPELFIPNSMNIGNDTKCIQEVIHKVKEFYFKDANVTEPYNWIQFMSQDLFVRGIIKTIDLIYQSLPMYVYLFSYTGGQPTSYFGGVGHYQEIQYLWHPKNENDIPMESDEDKLTSRRLITMWTNFANTSNPTPEKDELLQNIVWPQFDSTKPYLVFDGNLSISHNPNKQDTEFWNELYEKCGNPPYIIH